MIELEVRVDCGNEKNARRINDAVKIDNEGYVESVAKGKYVIGRMKGEPLSLLHTFNDFISCVQLALEVV